MSRMRLIALAIALLASFAVVASDVADARVGKGGSVGSRGSRTYSAPPSTNTAPKAAPIERSMTPRAGNPSQGVQPAAQASRFGGMRGLLMGGLFALALGSIFGFGTLASVLGFVLQFALIGGLVYLAVAFFRSRSQPALARGPSQGLASNGSQRAPAGFAGAAHGAPPAAAYAVTHADLDTFERLLGQTQTAFAREDADALGRITTPEMFSHFSHELADNARRGVRNQISDVKLLQGDVSEAWSEGSTTYATVAMRFSAIDATIDRATQRVVSGDLSRPTEAVEFWTFRRDARADSEGWQLSAIQQAA
ncbi:MAG: TIM44-like domain-containing protein [Hyphomicrobiaceae bacterium]|nr:TIM44-like domain-containing protein [Hyphomicrobiaceae bacterium]